MNPNTRLSRSRGRKTKSLSLQWLPICHQNPNTAAGHKPPPPHYSTMESTSTHLYNSPAGFKQSPEDKFLPNSHLSRQQVIRRRSHNMKQLATCYRDHYWGLMEEIRVRYREYLWKFGLSPVHIDRNEIEVEKVEIENQNVEIEQVKDEIEQGIGNTENSGTSVCGFHGCDSKAMILTSFCHVHILSDPKQQLYKPCEFVLRSAHSGPVPCGKPVLRSVVPSLCSMHFLKAQQHVVRALRKAGLNITSTNNFAPKFHLVVTEYVREIQERRKNSLRENAKKIVPKLEIDN